MIRKMKDLFQIFVLLGLLAYSSGEAYYRRILQKPEENFSCLILSSETVRKFKGFETNDNNELQITSKSAINAPSETKLNIHDTSRIFEIWGKNEEVVEAHIETLCKSRQRIPSLSPSKFQNQSEPEIVKIVDGGNQSNRIDVVFMGDGYTGLERDQFFDDMRRLTREMFEGITFRSYLPVFNIWAIYVESQESGIGYNGPKNTPFRLYRQAGQLRGIFPGNAQYARQVCQLTGTSGCDFPSLIGNDDFYGGLGGEFVISTKSNRTGTMVLRHEMGHNFVYVGEEYDNGGAYYGVNNAGTLDSVGWTHWLSEAGNAVEQRAVYRILQYPWQDLSQGQWSYTFNSDGAYSRWYLSVSVSAAGAGDSLEFTLDGQILPWQTTGFDDREFYDWYGDQGFVLGQHVFTVRSKTNATNAEIPRMICSVRLHEFGNEDEFHMHNNYVSAYPTWNVNGVKSYRPTNAGCLMRNMTHAEFCPVCKEGMWDQFLRRISLVDSLEVSSVPNPNGTWNVTLTTLQLGQLREPGNEVEGERLEVKWILNGTEQTGLRDLFGIQAQSGSWTVEIELITPEVRHDPRGLLRESEAFAIVALSVTNNVFG